MDAPTSLSSVPNAASPLDKEASSLLLRFLGPAADEMGLSLAEALRLLRFKNSLWVMKRAEAMAQKAGFEPDVVSAKILVPLLDTAALEDDDHMRERWAALLANSSQSRAQRVLPGFVSILGQLSSNEALILDMLLQRWHEDIDHNQIGNVQAKSFTRRLGVSGLRYEVMMGNLMRLGLCIEFVGRRLDMPNGHDPDASVRLTPFGMAFVEACQSPT